ncbi:MAG: aminoacyl-tRNA hydrolase [Candidatus Binatia bacterium]
MKLIVGLGNPGSSYERTRHNLGFLVIDRLAAQLGISLGKRVCDALVGEGAIESEKIVLAKPQTYMNRSGESAAALGREYGIGPEDLIVVNDDLDLPFGRIRIRPGGSAGGHRGLVSIMENLSGAEFHRVRIGVGRPPEGMEPAEYVLEPFDSAELEGLGEVVARAAESVSCLVRDGIERAMASYNRAI